MFKNAASLVAIARIICLCFFPACVHSAMTQEEFQLRKAMKSFAFGSITLQRAGDIGTGTQEPIESADVSEFAIINWQLLNQGQINEIANYLNLDGRGLQLSKVKVLNVPGKDNNAGKYLVSFRVGTYKIPSGTETRAEWVTYVRTEDDASPRVMIIDRVEPNPTYQCTEQTCTVTDHNNHVLLSFQHEDEGTLALHSEWIKAFDFKFGPDGLISKTYYNGSLILAQVAIAHLSNQDLNQSFISDILGPKAEANNAFFFPDPFVLGEVIKDNAIAQSFILPTMDEGNNIFNGGYDENSFFFVQDAEKPNYFISYAIRPDKVADMEVAIGLTLNDRLTLAPVKMTNNGPEAYILVVNIYNTIGVLAGLRAEWSVFVRKRDTPDSRPYFMVIEVSTSQGSFDPDDLLTPPAAKFDLFLEDNVALTYLEDETTKFEAEFLVHSRDDCTFPGPGGSSSRVGKSGKAKTAKKLCDILDSGLYLANDFILWSNGVADRLVYNSKVFETIVGVADLSQSKIELIDSRWSEFLIDTNKPLELIFFFGNGEFVINAWYTLEETVIVPGCPQMSFPINYYRGYQLDFVIDESTAHDLMPDSDFTPAKIKTGQTTSEDYYVSWYLAPTAANDIGIKTNRADIFTFAKDEADELSMVFIAAVIGLSPEILFNPLLFFQVQYEVEKLSLDPTTGKVAYPHYYVPVFVITHDGFTIIDFSPESPPPQPPKSSTIFSTSPCSVFSDKFAEAFVLANSQIYKTKNDRFVNYFDQHFIAAKLKSYPPACFASNQEAFDLNYFDPTEKGLFNITNLMSTFSYGDSDQAIRWYTELSSVQV